MDGERRITLDMTDVAWLVAGGELVLSDLNLIIMPASDLFRVANKVRTRVNGSRRIVSGKPRPKPEPE